MCQNHAQISVISVIHRSSVDVFWQIQTAVSIHSLQQVLIWPYARLIVEIKTVRLSKSPPRSEKQGEAYVGFSLSHFSFFFWILDGIKWQMNNNELNFANLIHETSDYNNIQKLQIKNRKLNISEEWNTKGVK